MALGPWEPGAGQECSGEGFPIKLPARHEAEQDQMPPTTGFSLHKPDSNSNNFCQFFSLVPSNPTGFKGVRSVSADAHQDKGPLHQLHCRRKMALEYQSEATHTYQAAHVLNWLSTFCGTWASRGGLNNSTRVTRFQWQRQKRRGVPCPVVWALPLSRETSRGRRFKRPSASVGLLR